MPTYEYVCEKGHRFEIFQSMKDAALSACTECGVPARRIIGPGAGFLFKGSGFYTTENRSKEYKKQAKAEAAGTSGSGTGGTAGGSDGSSAGGSTGGAGGGGAGAGGSEGASGGGSEGTSGGGKSSGGSTPAGGGPSST
jgi:putative FmdB family regulatory protein